MNRTNLKKFATWARNHLREQVAVKAARLGVSSKGVEEPQYVAGGMSVAGFTYDAPTTARYRELRTDLDSRIRAGASPKAAAQALIDEMAYTWFNRLTALRFMEVQGYLTRVLSSSTPGAVDPDILRDASALIQGGEFEGVTPSDLTNWRSQGDNATYRQLLIAQCRTLAESLPFLFSGSSHAELLLPDNLLSPQSIIRRIVSDIPESDWQDIEVIGWLYQFYIAERKDQVFASRGAVAASDIPAATQLFTPHWIVRYMVENSLGRLWLESHPDSKLREKMPYYLEESSAGRIMPLSADTLAKGSSPKHQPLQPQDLTVIDPACGSGHILVYAFDLLMEIYLEAGYPERDIPALILRHNLFGLDIDQRAAQLASFALMMKARARSRRILREPPPLHITHIAPSRGFSLPDAPELKRGDWQPLIDAFTDADNLGSLITPPDFDPQALAAQLSAYEKSGRLEVHLDAPRLRQLLKQADLLRRRYQAVVANPPYMGSKSFNTIVKDFVNARYPRSKSDLFAVFMEKSLELTAPKGIMSMINQHAWMFLSSYESLREHVLDNFTLQTMLHLGARAFPEVGGEVVQSTAFTIAQQPPKNTQAMFVRLVDYGSSELKEQALLNGEQRYYRDNQRDFEKIPGSPIAYWVSEKIYDIFEKEPKLGSKIEARQGLATGNNDRFLRLFWEVAFTKVGLYFQSATDGRRQDRKWFPINKGGPFRKWYGNGEYVVAFDIENRNILKTMGNHLPSEQLYFNPSVSWSDVTSAVNSFRYFPEGFLFDATGHSAFPNNELDRNLVLCYCNNKFINDITKVLNPTMHFHVGYFNILPFPTRLTESAYAIKLQYTADKAISLSKTDWDNFETSWDFQTHPLLRYGTSRLHDAFSCWQKQADEAFFELKRLEEENNRYWIEAYGLQDELSPEVPEDQVTIRRADLERDTKSLLSYAVGCMFGRYSLGAPGLQFAGGVFDRGAFTGEFLPDKSGIIPVTDAPYFEDDVVTQLVDFLRVAYGAEHLEDNLAFIADALTRRAGEGALERIRRYFVSEFVRDHNRTYSKRPIYWLFSSGKTGAFGALVYLHRYEPDTLAKMRNDYVLPLQGKLDYAMRQAQQDIATAESATARRAAERTLAALRQQAEELLDFQERLQHAADRRIRLDLDDGVAYNYTLFEGLLYEGPDLKMADLHKRSEWKRELLAQE